MVDYHHYISKSNNITWTLINHFFHQISTFNHIIFNVIASLQTSKKFFLRIALASLLRILFLLVFKCNARFSAAVICKSVAIDVFRFAATIHKKRDIFISWYKSQLMIWSWYCSSYSMNILPILNCTKFGLKDASWDMSFKIKSPPFAQNRRQNFKLWNKEK